MQVQIRDIEPLGNATEVSRVQRHLGFRLPISFLTQAAIFNGGTPASNVFDVPGIVEQSSIVRFFRLEEIPKNFDLLSFKSLGKYFPIATAVAGDKVCVSADGRVYFWDHERTEGQDDLIPLAATVVDFLESLRPFDKSEIRLQPGQVKNAWIDPSLLKKGS